MFLLWILFVLHITCGICSSMSSVPVFSCGVIADVQYADVDDGTNFSGSRRRYYRGSLEQLKLAVSEWSGTDGGQPVSFVLQLGDLIDGHANRQGHSVAALVTVMKEFTQPGCVHHTWGNHDLYNFTRRELQDTELNSLPLDQRSPGRLSHYYAFSPHPKFVFVILDTYSSGVLGYSETDTQHIFASNLLKSHNLNSDLNSPDGLLDFERRWVKYNGGLCEEQLAWLDDVLKQAAQASQLVIIAGHVPIHPWSCDPCAMIWNYDAVLSLLHQYSNVVAYLAGHDHGGGLYQDDTGMYHVTFPGVIEASPDTSCYGMLRIYPDRICLEGRGKVPSLTLAQWDVDK